MKKKLTTCLLLLSVASFLGAQEKTADKVMNTLKERLTVEGYSQLAYTYDDTEGAKANTFEVKRAILMLRGKVTDRWSVYFSYNFANTSRILEVYTEYKFMPELSVRLGEFKTMFTFENPMSPCNTELINVYSQATNYLTGYDSSDPLYGGNAGRDIGLMVYGDLFDKLFNYKLAVMNDLVTLTLLKGTGHAVGTSAINPDIQVGDNYTRNRWSAGAMLKFRPVDIRTEYLHGKDGNVRSDGYYAVASVHVCPKIDVIAAVDYFNRHKALKDWQANYVIGAQWWFYPKCRLQLQYTYRDPHLRESSNLLQTQIQVRF